MLRPEALDEEEASLPRFLTCPDRNIGSGDSETGLWSWTETFEDVQPFCHQFKGGWQFRESMGASLYPYSK